jgi:hypothetical protein
VSKIKKTVFFIVLFLFFISLASNVLAQTQITTCTQITESGEYVLANDLDARSNTYAFCIDIRTDNVVIDCNNYKIIGPAQAEYSSGINVDLNRTNITIKNCKIYNFNESGIFLRGNNSNINIDNVYLENNRRGIFIAYYYDVGSNYSVTNSVFVNNIEPLPIDKSKNVLIRNVSIEGFYNTTAIEVMSGGENVLIENCYVKNYYKGIVSRAIYSIIRNNLVVIDAPPNSFISDASAYRLEGANNSIFYNNTAIGDDNLNMFAGLWLCCPINDNVTIENNNFTKVRYGVGGESINIYVRNNYIDHFLVGMNFYNSTGQPSYNIYIENNTIIHRYGYDGYNLGFGPSANVLVRNNILIVYLTDTKNFLDGIRIDGDVTDVAILNNTIFAYNINASSGGASIILRSGIHKNIEIAYNILETNSTVISLIIGSSSRSLYNENLTIHDNLIGNFIEGNPIVCSQLANCYNCSFYRNVLKGQCLGLISYNYESNNLYVYENIFNNTQSSAEDFFYVYGKRIYNVYQYNNTVTMDKPYYYQYYPPYYPYPALDNIYHLTSTTLEPYLSYVFSYSSIDYGTTTPYNKYYFYGNSTTNSNRLDISYVFDATDLYNNTDFIGKGNLTVSLNNTYVFGNEYSLPTSISVWGQKMVEEIINRIGLYIPLVKPGIYTGNITATVQLGRVTNWVVLDDPENIEVV